MAINRRQFFISNKKIDISGFEKFKLKNNYFIYYDKDLHIEKVSNPSKNDEIYILGYAFQTDPTRDTPVNELIKHEYTSIEECYETWSGRWVLYYNGEIHMDASGTLGVFYAVKGEEIYISSSCKLINEFGEVNIRKNVEKINHREGMDWYPGPLSILENTKRLLSCQILLLEKNNIKINYRETITDKYNNMEDEKIINLIIKHLEELIKNIHKEYDGDIILPLTAGYDSRTLLSILLKTNIKFSTITLEHKKIPIADKEIPKILSEKFNFKHEFIGRNANVDKEKLEEFDKHCFSNCVDEDRLFYGYNQFPQKNKAILLRGAIWGVANNFYKLINVGDDDNDDTKLRRIKENFLNVYDGNFHEESIREWIKTIKEQNINIEFSDRFFFEQRQGAWLSSIEQGLDLTDFDRIHPANSKIIISLLMSLSSSFRKNKNHQLEIIKIESPELIKYPFNQKTYKESTERVIGFLYKMYRKKGMVGAVKEVRRRIIG